MTAYGRESQETKLGKFTVEIRSVNRKYLETNIVLPDEFSCFEVDVKKWLSEVIERGQISVKISVVLSENVPLKVSPNIHLALKIREAAEKLNAVLKLPSLHELTLQLLSDQPKLLLFEEQMNDEELYRETLHEVFQKALIQFLQMKTKEGYAIFVDISHRLGTLQQEIKKIATYAPQATKRYREKLIERLKELDIGEIENEERIIRELGIFAERIDISEEITLFEAHLEQFYENISSKNKSIGKKLEFLLQEMNREINTIGSKSSDLEVSRLVIEMKSTLEKIREIIQNVE